MGFFIVVAAVAPSFYIPCPAQGTARNIINKRQERLFTDPGIDLNLKYICLFVSTFFAALRDVWLFYELIMEDSLWMTPMPVSPL
jgi:hypothetical protein